MASTPVPDMPYMHLVESTGEVKFSSPEVDYPLYIKALGNLTVKFGNTYEYSKDNVTWTSATSSTSISAVAGERVFFRASGLTASSSKGIGSFTISNGDCNVGGNIMSMVYGADFKGKTEITQAYQFYRLFYISSATSTSNMRIIDASGLALPATAMTNYCYAYMFYNQQKLTSSPALPATTLATYCYLYMFYNCSSLVNAHALPATTLTESCYYNMFYGCSSLVNAPTLPATTLANNCYRYMFYNCTSLRNAPALPATTLATQCYQYMFYGCSSLTTAPELPAITLTESCYGYMFQGCTNLVNAPVLPATTLAKSCYSHMLSGTNFLPDCSNIDFDSYSVVSKGALIGLFAGTRVRDEDLAEILPINADGKYCLPYSSTSSNCYQYMFQGCINLVTAPELPATTLLQYCYSYMFDGCTSLVNAPALPVTKAAQYCYEYMFRGCTSLVNAPALPATTLATQCYQYMFYGCTSLVNAPALPATTLAQYCYTFMFYGCTSLVNAPELPATTLASYCYKYMFLSCSKLSYIKAMFTTAPSSSSNGHTYRWVEGVSSTGTFVKNSAATWADIFGTYAIPEGWTVELADA